MELEEALEIADRCEIMPIDTLEFADMCITALKISLDETDVIAVATQAAVVTTNDTVAGLQASLEITDYVAGIAILFLLGFVFRWSLKVSRLQGEFDAYRSGKS